ERVSLLPAEMFRIGIVRLCWYLARGIYCGRRPVRLDAVHVQHRVTHVERIAAGSNETLDERRRGIVAVVRLIRRHEHHNVSLRGSPITRQAAIGEGNVRAVRHLVDEQPITHEQRWNHAARRNSVSLCDERAEREKDRDDNRESLHILPYHMAW